jgi:toxin ParE1/3/4
VAILRESARLFGPKQRERYANLIRAAAEMVAADPLRPGSRARNDLGTGVRSFHVELAARRRGAASHLLYYLPADQAPDAGGIMILRILHEAMEPSRHLGAEEP